MEKHYEKIWDCESCGRTQISALRFMRCPSCGASKPGQNSEKYTLREVTDAEGIELVKGGVNWVCAYCSSVNLAKHSECTSCGNPKGFERNESFKVKELGKSMPATIDYDANSNGFDQVEQYINNEKKKDNSNESEITDYSTSSDIIDKAIQYKEKTNKKANQTISFRSIARRITKEHIIVATIIVVLSLLAIMFFSTKSVVANVSGFSWERNIRIEEYNTYREEGWSTPVGAYNITSRTEIHHYENIYETETKQVPYTVTKYRDNGNGSVTSYTETEYRTETVQKLVGTRPVYGTYYLYNIDKWVYKRTLGSTGNDKNPYWAEVELVDRPGKIGDEREAGRSEQYKVYFRYENKDKMSETSKEFNLSEWSNIKQGTKFTIHVNMFGVVLGDVEQVKR